MPLPPCDHEIVVIDEMSEMTAEQWEAIRMLSIQPSPFQVSDVLRSRVESLADE